MDSYPRCATCTHYLPAENWDYPPVDGICQLVTNGADGAEIVTTDRSAYVRVQPDFGCIEHEPKES